MLFREREKKNTGMERREWHRELQHLKQRFSMCSVIVRVNKKKKDEKIETLLGGLGPPPHVA